MKLRPKAIASLIILIILILCAACAEPSPPPRPTIPPPTPSPTPEPKILTVCLSEEPQSLYLYGSTSLAAQHIWQAIYDGPLDNHKYTYQPVILDHLPTLANGGATVMTTTVQAGERVLATSGEVIELIPGIVVRDIHGQRVTFENAQVLMPQMVVTFTLKPDLYWSDGTPLTANDSVFSYVLAAASDTPSPKYSVERTATYRAVDARTVVWRGVPGHLDHTYALNFWHPLPQHAWGHLSATELISAEVSTRHPLGWGPFTIQEWISGDHLTAVRNPIYFRSTEGLPHLDQVVFRFISNPTVLAEELVAGRCDVATHDIANAVHAALPEQSPVEALSSYDTRWEFLAFGISPHLAYDRPDFFEDVRVRQAIALCIDRQAIISQTLGPSRDISHSYVPSEHPLYAGEQLTTWGYAASAGQTLLATAGWYDEDGDGVREAHNIPGVADGTPFQITYHTTNDPVRVQVAHLIQIYLSACGIQITPETLPSEVMFNPGPEGIIFGRRFDLAQLSWRATSDPLCDLFLSSHVPDAGHWDKPNVTGFLDDEYDAACLSALDSFPDSAEYIAGQTRAQVIFSERLPLLPFFQRSKTTLARPNVVGLAPDATQVSELWNIEQIDLHP